MGGIKAGPNGLVSSSDKSTSMLPKTSTVNTECCRKGTPEHQRPPGPRNA
jgi:hypothetical protein